MLNSSRAPPISPAAAAPATVVSLALGAVLRDATSMLELGSALEEGDGSEDGACELEVVLGSGGGELVVGAT